MAQFDASGLRAVVFDFGSTLVEFGERQLRACDRALADVMARLYGSADLARVQAVRDRQRREPYSGDFRENDLPEISARLVREVCGVEAAPEHIELILETRYRAFVEQVEAREYVRHVLQTLRERYLLGFLSNYPDAPAIRDSLRKIGLHDLFDAVVVSGEVGRVKPHPLPFLTVLGRLGARPEEALYVGDNWLGDIQGAKRVGMKAAHILQFETPEVFERQPGDHDADLVIHHLTDLLDHLKGNGAPCRT